MREAEIEVWQPGTFTAGWRRALTMANEWQRMHGPADSAPAVTNLVATCKVCRATWQVWGNPPTNTHGCPFCDAPERAITIADEKPRYTGTLVHGVDRV